MRAVLYEQFGGPLQLISLPDPTPPPDGVVVRVRATGICRSDWHGWMGHDPDIRLPHVPGHELAGVIEATGQDVRCWRPGDRVTVPFAVGCGRCAQCLAGHPHICDDYFQPGFTAWGSFAEYVSLPHADTNLVRLPEDLDFVAAASLGCRFTTSFRAVVHQGRVRPGEWVAVHGCGGVGLAVCGRHVQVGLMLGDDRDPPLPMHAVIAGELELLGSHGMPAHAWPGLLDLPGLWDLLSRLTDGATLRQNSASTADRESHQVHLQ